MSETSDKIKIMQAFEDGETVEVQLNREGHWGRVIYTNWDWASNNYRVKRQPREFYALPDSEEGRRVFVPAEKAHVAFAKRHGYIRVREILD